MNEPNPIKLTKALDPPCLWFITEKIYVKMKRQIY
jgi:hypothetical protein